MSCPSSQILRRPSTNPFGEAIPPSRLLSALCFPMLLGEVWGHHHLLNPGQRFLERLRLQMPVPRPHLQARQSKLHPPRLLLATRPPQQQPVHARRTSLWVRREPACLHRQAEPCSDRCTGQNAGGPAATPAWPCKQGRSRSRTTARKSGA